MITFYLTSIGKTTLAELELGTTITINRVIITDASSPLTITTPSGLSGNIVFSQSLEGVVIDSKLHLEFLDDTDNQYIGKTLAITFRKSGTEYIFALATDGDGLFNKTPSLLQAVIEVQFDDADSITFQNTNVSFPPATTTRNGSVRLATASEITNKSGSGVITANGIGAFVDLTTNQTIDGVKTFSQTISGTVNKAINDENGNRIKTASNLDYVTAINPSASSTTTTIPNVKSVIDFVSSKISDIALNNQVGSIGVFVYTETGNSKSIGDTVSGTYLKPVAITLSITGNLSFTIDDSVSLSGNWKLLSSAFQRTANEKSVVLAVKTE